MDLLIVKGLCPDQIFIKGMAKMRKVESSKDTVPVGIVALGPIEIDEGILIF